MAPTLKIALIQFQAKPLLLEKNFAKAESQIRQAVSEGSQLAVLPEYHLTSWVPKHPNFIAACTESMKYLPRYQALSRELNINIVPGTIVEPVKVASSVATDDETESVIELRNMTYFIEASTGDILSTYQKKNLWYLERGILTADRSSPHKAFDVPLPEGVIRVGLLICWDLAFPEALRELVADGAQLVVIPAYWHLTELPPQILGLNMNSEVAFLDSATVARAFENTCAVAFCNAFGQSQVTMPILGSLGKVEIEKEGMVVHEVDFDVLRIAEEHYKVREDLKSEGWHYSNCVTRPLE